MTVGDPMVRFETMVLEIDGAVATVVLNRPHVLNCIDEQWLGDFHAALDLLAADERLRVVVVRGAGRAFCSGIDLRALAHRNIGPAFFRSWEEALRRLETMDPLVVAAIHSHCIGGGLQLALACDLRVARTDARFAVTAVKEGIIPGMGMWRIARHAGIGRAKRLALSADVVDAETALAWGLIDYTAEPEAYDARVGGIVDRLLSMAWTSTRLTKRLVNAALDLPFAAFLDMFCVYQQTATASPEHQAAMEEWRRRPARTETACDPADAPRPDTRGVR